MLSDTARRAPHPKNKLAVRELHVNIGNSTLEEDQRLAPPGLPICQAEWPEEHQCEDLLVAPPEALGDFVAKALDSTMYPPIYDPHWFKEINTGMPSEEYASIFECVDLVSLGVEGSHKKEWIMKDVLDGLDDSRYFKFKKKMRQKRAKNGLEI